MGSLAKVAKIKAPSESHSQPFSSRDAPCQRSHKGLTGHRQNRGRGGAKRSVEIHDLEKQGREFSDLDEASGHLHHSALSDARSLPNGIPYGDRTRSTPIHAVVAVMRLLVSVRYPRAERVPPGTQDCSGPDESGYRRRARWRGTLLACRFKSASISVSAGLVFAAQSRPRSILERSGSVRVQSWLSGTIATAVRTMRPSLNRSRRSVFPA